MKILTKLINKINQSEKKEILLSIIEKLQLLRKNGKTDSEISHIIYELDLPLNIHLFINGNFSDLMKLEIKKAS